MRGEIQLLMLIQEYAYSMGENVMLSRPWCWCVSFVALLVIASGQNLAEVGAYVSPLSLNQTEATCLQN